jgi:hypothetical protein
MSGMRELSSRRRLRFSLKALFVGIALVAIGLMQLRRYQTLVRRADEHAFVARVCELMALKRPAIPLLETTAAMPNPQWLLTRAEYHRQLSQKYRQTVWHPWLALESDPPRPL